MSNYDETFFVNYEKKVGGFQKLLRPDIPKSVMVIEAPKDMGKTWLINRLLQYCRQTEIPVATINFGDAFEIHRIEDSLGLIRLLRDKLEYPHYFNQLNAVINQFTDPDFNHNTSGLATLSRNIEQYFDLSELEDLVFDLNIRYDNLAGTTLRAKTRELVTYCDRNNLIDTLIAQLKIARPHVSIDWREGLTPATSADPAVDASSDTPVADKLGRIQVYSEEERRHAERQINESFFKCLNELLADHNPAVFFLDAVEKAPAPAARWIQQELLGRLRQGTLKNVNVIMTGRKGMDLTNLQIKHLLVETALPPLSDEHIQEYIFNRRGIVDYELNFFVDASGGVPGLLAIMADNVLRKYEDADDDFFSDV